MKTNSRRQSINRILGMTCALSLLPCTEAISQPAILDLDVPFVVTPDNVVLRMLDMALVSAQDTVLDLGSGDGRIVITAALRYGASGSGVEIDPNLVTTAREHARRAGVEGKAHFETKDLFETDLSQASVITMYLLPDVNLALRPRLLGLRPGVRLVSHDWDMGEWAPDHQSVIDAPEKILGLKKVARLMLWVVPARVEGKHRAPGFELEINQKFQRIESAHLNLGNERISLAPSIVRGPTVMLSGTDASNRSLVRVRLGTRTSLAADADSLAACNATARRNKTLLPVLRIDIALAYFGNQPRPPGRQRVPGIVQIIIGQINQAR